jgi:hypothetical protein
MMAEDGAPKGRLGFRALLDRGYSASRHPKSIPEALSAVIQETVALWCKLFVDAGIPGSRLYPHVVPQMPIETTGTAPSAAFNRWSRPGWTTYPVARLADGFEPLYADLRKRGAPPWAGVEANAGMPGASVDWETYLGWHYNHGAVIVAVNTGATGTELPDRLEKSAFGPEALAAFRKFLRGETLKEKPLSADKPEARLRRRMQELQEGFRRWHEAGRDPSPIARMVEQRVRPLLDAGKVEEAIAAIEEGLKALKRGGPGGAPPRHSRSTRPCCAPCASRMAQGRASLC